MILQIAVSNLSIFTNPPGSDVTSQSARNLAFQAHLAVFGLQARLSLRQRVRHILNLLIVGNARHLAGAESAAIILCVASMSVEHQSGASASIFPTGDQSGLLIPSCVFVALPSIWPKTL